MGEILGMLKKHPELIGIAVIAVIVLAYLNSKSGGGSSPADGGVSFTGGGVAPLPVDPNVAAMDEAHTSANAANLSTLSQLYLGVTQTAAEKDVQNNQTTANLTAALAQTEAQRVVGLASINSQTTIATGQTAAQIQEAKIAADEQLNAANVTSQMAANAEAANLSAIALENQRQLEVNATQRDIARVNAKSGFWDHLFSDAGSVLATIFAV